MSVDIKTGEIIETDVAAPNAAIVKRPTTMADMVKPQEIPLMEMLSTMDNLDWKSLKPHQTALLIMQKPFVAQGGGSMYLSFKQAILFATRCYELGVSPFSSEVWFDPNRATVNLTLEGKRQLLRNRNIDTGPPSFEERTRDWSELPKMSPVAEELKKSGYNKDVGVVCKIRVGKPEHNEHVTYVAWLSEWFVGRSPVWVAKPTHMLQTRATEKAISLVLGTGSSDPITDE